MLHDLVLALARHIRVRQDHLDIAPPGVAIQPLLDVVVQRVGWADGVRAPDDEDGPGCGGGE